MRPLVCLPGGTSKFTSVSLGYPDLCSLGLSFGPALFNIPVCLPLISDPFSPAVGLQEEVLRVVVQYEICGLGGGSVSGSRDGQPGYITCPDPIEGFSCKIVTNIARKRKRCPLAATTFLCSSSILIP